MTFLPGPLFDFLARRGAEWDAPCRARRSPSRPIPGPEVFDTRKRNFSSRSPIWPRPTAMPTRASCILAATSWALSSKHTADGRAFVANDMHLGVRIPLTSGTGRRSVWQPPTARRTTRTPYDGRPRFPQRARDDRQQQSATSPWGFTNSQGDWVDDVVIDVDPHDKDSYLTPKGTQKFDHHTETIKVKGAPRRHARRGLHDLGPRHRSRPQRPPPRDPLGGPRYRRREHGPDAHRIGTDAQEAMHLANLTATAQTSSSPTTRGAIGWTIMGRIPRAFGSEGRLPTSWADGKRRWDGYLKPEEYPRIVDPADGRIWTANARVVADADLAKMGDGFYDLGARRKTNPRRPQSHRQGQRDRHAQNPSSTTGPCSSSAGKSCCSTRSRPRRSRPMSPRRAEKIRQNWGGHAAIDSVGFREVRTFRIHLVSELSDVLVSPCKKIDKNFSIAGLDRTEGPIWRLVSERPRT